MKPVSRKRTSNVGPSRFNPTIPRNQEKTKEGSKTHITAHKNFCVLLEKTSMHEPSSDTTLGERRMGNKNFPTRTKTYHGDVHLREGMSDLRTLVDHTAEALVNAVDVVERPHVPRSAPRTIPRSVPRSSTERTAPPRSAHVQLDDDLGLLDPARETER